MSRQRMKKRSDRRVFRNTAVKSKKVNVEPVIYRGGIRL